MASNRQTPTDPARSASAFAAGAAQGCLTDNEVLDFAGGGMEPPDRERAEAHLQTCPDCRRLVSEAVLALAPDAPSEPPPAEADRSPCVPSVVLPQVGDVVDDKYEIERVVGQGGMGVVFAAKHLMLDHPVALKFLWSPTALSEAGKQRFLREGQAALRIESDHVTRVMDVGVTDRGAPYVVMELLRGRDVRSTLATEGPLPWREVVRIALQALDAVGAAHEAGVIHRDLKPANLFLVQAHQDQRVKVLDFGVSKVTGDQKSTSLTTTQATLGSPVYMAPEQMEDASKVDARADVWSIGATMFEMTTGVPPFGGSTLAALHRAILESKGVSVRDRVPDVPRSIDAVIRRSLSVDPAGRYENGKAMREALEEAMADLQDGSPHRWSASLRRTLLLVGTAAAVMAVATLFWMRSGAQASPPAPEAAPSFLPAAFSGTPPAPTSGAAMAAPPSLSVSTTVASTGPPRSDFTPTTPSPPRLGAPAVAREVPAAAVPAAASASAVPTTSPVDPDLHAPGLSDRK